MMAYFPLFVDLDGRTGLIVGGGAVALRKAQKLLPYGPRLMVVAPEINPGFRELQGVELLQRPFADADLDGCAFAVAATDDRALNHRVAKLCGQNSIPVNVADSREDSTFLFPALLRRGELSVGVCGGGLGPGPVCPGAAGPFGGNFSVFGPNPGAGAADRAGRREPEAAADGVGRRLHGDRTASDRGGISPEAG